MPLLSSLFAGGAAVKAAMIGAGASAAAGIANNVNQRVIANKQLQKNYELWKEQNAYNSPSAQVARLKSAGLNPALAYGGSSQVVGNADTTPQLDYSGAINTPMFGSDSAIQLGMSAAQMSKQFEVQDANIEAMQAQALRDRAQAASTDALREPSVQQLLSQNSLNLAKTSESYQAAEVLKRQGDLLLTQKDLNIQETRGYELQNEYAARTMEFRVAAADLNNKEALSRIKVNQALAAKYSTEIDKILAETRVEVAREMNINEDTNLKSNQALEARFNARVLAASENKVKALTDQIKTETHYTQKQIDWFAADHIASYIGTGSKAFGDIVNGSAHALAAGASAGIL